MKKSDANALRAASWYTISNFISKAIIYIVTPLYTRFLTLNEYGEYNNFLTWQSLLVVMVSLNLYSTVNVAYMDFSEEKDFQKYISTISIFSILVPLCCSIVILFKTSAFMRIFNMTKVQLYMLLIIITFSSLLNIFQAEQRMEYKYKVASAITLISAIGSTGISVIFALTFEEKLTGILLGNIIFTIIINVFILIYYCKRCLCFLYKYIKYALPLAIPLIPHILSSNLMSSADRIMITKYCGVEKVGLYSLVSNISLIVIMFLSSINQAWVPWLYERLKNNDVNKIRKVANYSYILIGIIGILLCLVSPEVVWIMGGDKFKEAVYLMPPIIMGCIINFLYTLYVNIEFYNRKTINISLATIIAAIVNVVLNYIGIRSWGYVMAAYTTLFSNFILFALHYYFVKKQMKQSVYDIKKLIRLTVVFSIVMILILVLYKYQIIRYMILLALLLICMIFVYKQRKIIIEFVQHRG